MFVASPYGKIIALGPTTGKEKWSFEIPGGDIPSTREVAYGPGAPGFPAAVVFGIRRGQLLSIKASDGTLNKNVGTVNLKTPGVMPTGMDLSYTLPSPPVAYKNLIITGAGTGICEGPGGSNVGAGPSSQSRCRRAP
jgi:quinoprotein glucose dehydrogenase